MRHTLKRLMASSNKPDISHLLVTGAVWRSGNCIDRSRDKFTVIYEQRFGGQNPETKTKGSFLCSQTLIMRGINLMDFKRQIRDWKMFRKSQPTSATKGKLSVFANERALSCQATNQKFILKYWQNLVSRRSRRSRSKSVFLDNRFVKYEYRIHCQPEAQITNDSSEQSWC